MRADAIFDDLSRESDKNRATIEKKGREISRSAVANKAVTPTAASNALAKIGIKVSVSTLCQDIQRTADAPLPTRGPPLLFSEEAEVKMANLVVAM